MGSPFFVDFTSYCTVKINGEEHRLRYSGVGAGRDITWLIGGDNLQSWDENDSYMGNYTLTIFEYPISASGTDQGMDYIVP